MMSSLPEQTTPESLALDPTVIQPMPQATSRGRLFFLDHLRAALTILVVMTWAVAAPSSSPIYHPQLLLLY